jgi:hypothetical protein
MQTARPVRLGARHAAGSNAAIRGVRAAAPRARAAASRLVVRAEKVVGIDLGTTNSAVRAPDAARCSAQGSQRKLTDARAHRWRPWRAASPPS